MRVKNSWIVLCIVAVIVIAAVMTIVGRKESERLPAYDGTDVLTESSSVSSSEEGETIDTFLYEDSETGFTCSIPSDWEQVNEGETVRFIHRASGTAIQIEKDNYYPGINNESAENVSEKVTGNGYTFVSFNRYSTHTYEVVYQDKKNSTFDYIQDVHWSRNSIVSLTFIVNDSYYEKMEGTMNTVLSSATFTGSDAISDDVYLYYSSAGSFEFGIPYGWTLGVAENAYVASDTDTGASMTVALSENTNPISKLTMLDMSDIMKSNKSGYILKSFDSADDMAIGTASYTSGETQMMFVQYIFTRGGYWYFISFSYPEDTYDTGFIQDCAGMFRSFLSDGTATSADSSAEDAEEPEAETSAESPAVTATETPKE